MPNKSKSSGAHRRANLLRLRRERALFVKRSEAAKRGWVTRRLRERGIEPDNHQVVITRLKYKRKGKRHGGQIDHIEVVEIDGEIDQISINGKTYNSPGDIEALRGVMETAEPEN